MTPLPKFPLLLKILWVIPFPLLLVMVAAVDLPVDGVTCYSALFCLSMTVLFFMLTAAAGTVFWLTGGMMLPQPDFATDSRPKCK